MAAGVRRDRLGSANEQKHSPGDLPYTVTLASMVTDDASPGAFLLDAHAAHGSRPGAETTRDRDRFASWWLRCVVNGCAFPRGVPASSTTTVTAVRWIDDRLRRSCDDIHRVPLSPCSHGVNLARYPIRPGPGSMAIRATTLGARSRRRGCCLLTIDCDGRRHSHPLGDRGGRPQAPEKLLPLISRNCAGWPPRGSHARTRGSPSSLLTWCTRPISGSSARGPTRRGRPRPFLRRGCGSHAPDPGRRGSPQETAQARWWSLSSRPGGRGFLVKEPSEDLEALDEALINLRKNRRRPSWSSSASSPA